MPIYKIQVKPIKLPKIVTNFKIPNTNQMSVNLSLSMHYNCCVITECSIVRYDKSCLFFVLYIFRI
jgi:hypothetical protein